MTGNTIEVDAVIFDLDDTLICEHDFVLSGYAAVAKLLAPLLGAPEQELLQRLVKIYDSPNRSRAFNALLDPFERADLVPFCVDTYRSHSPHIALTDSAETILGHMLGQVPVGVVTDGPLVMQEAKVTALNLRQRGIEVVCTDALGGRDAWKPAPAGLLEAVSKLGVAPNRAVYIADNPHKDFIATARSGVRSVRLRHEGQLHYSCQATNEGAPEFEVSDLLEINSVISWAKSSDIQINSKAQD